MSSSTVVAGKRKTSGGGLSEEAAFAWLMARGQIKTTSTELAAAWSMNRSKVKRLLVQWTTEGRIVRTISADRKITTIVCQGGQGGEPPQGASKGSLQKGKARDIYQWFDDVTPPDQRNTVDRSTNGPAGKSKRSTNGPDGADGGPQTKTSGPQNRLGARVLAFIVGTTLIVIGLGMGWVSLRINQEFGASLASTAEAAVLWREGSFFADVFKMVALAGAAILWSGGRRGLAAVLALVWLLTLAYAVMAAAGFTSKNIADSTAQRGSVASERERLTADIARLRAGLGWNAAIEAPQHRSAASIQVALQTAQPRVPVYVWKATNGCTDVTIEPSREACREVLALRGELDAATRREVAATDLREKEAQLGKLPAVASADPQAQTISRVVHWLSAGQASFGEGDVQLTRFLLIMLVIELPGALGLSAGIEIWRRTVF